MLGLGQSAQQQSVLSILGVLLYSYDGAADAPGHRARFGRHGTSWSNTEGTSSRDRRPRCVVRSAAANGESCGGNKHSALPSPVPSCVTIRGVVVPVAVVRFGPIATADLNLHLSAEASRFDVRGPKHPVLGVAIPGGVGRGWRSKSATSYGLKFVHGQFSDLLPNGLRRREPFGVRYPPPRLEELDLRCCGVA
jgi:hypothetical protein